MTDICTKVQSTWSALSVFLCLDIEQALHRGDLILIYLYLSMFVLDVEQALRRDLRRTKALLQDAQLMLQKNKEGLGNRTTVKQLRNQVIDE